jgi:hypothetical protein
VFDEPNIVSNRLNNVFCKLNLISDKFNKAFDLSDQPLDLPKSLKIKMRGKKYGYISNSNQRCRPNFLVIKF